MPLYEYRCEQCGRVVEEYFPTATDARAPLCWHDGHRSVTEMVKVPSRRAGHRLTGDAERGRIGHMISKFHRDYLNSPAGREQMRDDPRGKVDVCQIADAMAGQGD